MGGHTDAVAVSVDKVRASTRAARAAAAACLGDSTLTHATRMRTSQPSAEGGSNEFGMADPNAPPFVYSHGITTEGARPRHRRCASCTLFRVGGSGQLQLICGFACAPAVACGVPAAARCGRARGVAQRIPSAISWLPAARSSRDCVVLLLAPFARPDDTHARRAQRLRSCCCCTAATSWRRRASRGGSCSLSRCVLPAACAPAAAPPRPPRPHARR